MSVFVVKVNGKITFWSCHYWPMNKENNVQTLPINIMVVTIFSILWVFLMTFILPYYGFMGFAHVIFDTCTPQASFKGCWMAQTALGSKLRVVTRYSQVHWAVLHLPSLQFLLRTTCSLWSSIMLEESYLFA